MLYGIIDYDNGHRDTVEFDRIKEGEHRLQAEVNAHPGSRARLYDGKRMLACYEPDVPAPITLRVYKPFVPTDSWYNSYITIGGIEYPIGGSSVCREDCVYECQEIARGLSAVGAGVSLSEL